MTEHPGNGSVLKSVLVVTNLQQQLRTRLCSQRKRKTAVAIGTLHIPHLEARAVIAQTLARWETVKHHQRLEQILPALHFTPTLHFHQRTELTLPQLHHLRLQPTQPWSYLRLPIHTHTHRQTVDEQSHHLFYTRQLRR